MIYAIKLGENAGQCINYAWFSDFLSGKNAVLTWFLSARDVLNISPCSGGFMLLMLILSEFSTKMVRVDGFFA